MVSTKTSSRWTFLPPGTDVMLALTMDDIFQNRSIAKNTKTLPWVPSHCWYDGIFLWRLGGFLCLFQQFRLHNRYVVIDNRPPRIRPKHPSGGRLDLHPPLLRCWRWWHTSCPQRFVSQGNLCQTAVPVSVSTLTVVLCTNTTYMPNILLRWTFNTFNVYLYVWYFGLVCCTVVVRISKFELLYLWLQCCRIEEMYGGRICGIHNSLFATSGAFFLETALVLLPSQAILGCWSGRAGLKIFRRLL